MELELDGARVDFKVCVGCCISLICILLVMHAFALSNHLVRQGSSLKARPWLGYP